MLEFAFPSDAGGSWVIDIYGAIAPNPPASLIDYNDALGRPIFGSQGPTPTPLGIYIGAANLDPSAVTLTNLYGPDDSGEFVHWSGTVKVSDTVAGEMSLYVVYNDTSPTDRAYEVGIALVSATQVAVPYRVKPGTRRSHFA